MRAVPGACHPHEAAVQRLPCVQGTHDSVWQRCCHRTFACVRVFVGVSNANFDVCTYVRVCGVQGVLNHRCLHRLYALSSLLEICWAQYHPSHVLSAFGASVGVVATRHTTSTLCEFQSVSATLSFDSLNSIACPPQSTTGLAAKPRAWAQRGVGGLQKPRSYGERQRPTHSSPSPPLYRLTVRAD